ncbi:MAG: glycosyltransferase family 9 protein [Flavobacteriia bacterium]|nr:glycosyltransferase family 9 protein [Flavobacteriia bacterium]
MSDIGFENVRQDCVFFRGSIPCVPNKQTGAVCTSCEVYRPVSKRILIIKLGALGDVIRTTPLVVKFREEFPDCHITWLTQSPEVLPKDSINVILKPDAFSLLLIQHSVYDIAINLDKEPEACLLLKTVSAPEKFGYTSNFGQLYPATPAATHKLMTGFFDQLSQENTKSYPAEIFEICHRTFQHEPYLIHKNETLATAWKERLQTMANGKVIVGLNTGCGPRWNTRLWPVESWQELAASLKDAGYFPVFLGGSLEDEKNTAMSEQTGTYYPGHFSLEEFIALTNGCDVILTQVSMMMHIATALQKKMVLMNNIFNKHEFELYGRGEIIEPSTNCECYYGNTCKRNQSCMHDLSATEVAAAIDRVASLN